MKPRFRDSLKAKVGTRVYGRMTYGERVVHGILGRNSKEIPESLLLTSTPFVFKQASAKLKKPNTKGRLTIGKFENKVLGIIDTGIGTPAATIVMEAIVRTKPQAIVRADFCGGLSEVQKIGDALVADTAIIGDGCGAIYFGAGTRVHANADLSDHVVDISVNAGLKVHRGESWTTDILFKQTVEVVADWIKKGAISVDMESSAILGLSQEAGIPAASLNCISDLPAHGRTLFQSDEVDPHFLRGLDLVLESGLRSLAKWNMIE